MTTSPSERCARRRARQILGTLAVVGISMASVTLAVSRSHAAVAETIIVNASGDSLQCDPSLCTLRGAVYQANNRPGPDLIQFSSGGDGEIFLRSGALNLADDVTIDATDHSVVIDGNNAHPIFVVSGNVVASLSGLTLTNGRALQGGAITNAGSLTIVNSTFSNNHAVTADVAMEGNGYVVNSANAEGGAIYNVTRASLTIKKSLFVNNSAVGGNASVRASIGSVAVAGEANGGAIMNAGRASLVVENSTFIANVVLGGSGTVVDSDDSVANGTSARGGAIANGSVGRPDPAGPVVTVDAVLTVVNSTFNANIASAGTGSVVGGAGSVSNGGLSYGDALSNDSTTGVGIRNSVFADHAAACSGIAMTDEGGNMSSDASCAFPNPNSRNSTDPQLRGLSANGGPTRTLALRVGSPAIGLGVALCPAADQRGVARLPSRCDSGAFEVSGVDKGSTTGPANPSDPPTTGLPIPLSPVSTSVVPGVAVSDVAASGSPTSSTTPPASVQSPTITSSSTTAPASTTAVPNEPQSNSLVIALDAQQMTVDVRGSGYLSGTRVKFVFHSTPVDAGSTLVAADGTFAATLSIPAELEPGQHEVEAIGTRASGVSTSVRTPFVLARDALVTPPTQQVAFTGSETSTMLRSALVMLLLGVLVCSVSRRETSGSGPRNNSRTKRR